MKFAPIEKSQITEYVELWNRELGKHFPMREELFIQNSFHDKNVFRNGSFSAYSESGNLLGFIITKKWQEDLDGLIAKDVGWIQVLLVDSAYRKQGIGSTLLDMAEHALKESAIKQIVIAQDPWHYFPGVPKEYENTMKFLENRGYTNSTSVFDLYKEFNEEEEISLPAKDGVIFQLLDESDKEAFIDFMNTSFPGRWTYEAVKYFEKGNGREFVVLKKSGRIIGFCRINDSNSPFIAQNVYWSNLFHEELGGIGPLGITESERKNGYGLAIVQAGIYFLRKRNIKHMVIDWTELTEFYGKLGFKIWKEYKRYKKVINAAKKT